jgi:hypothetical protein
MNLDALHEGYKRILHYIYSPKPFYQRVRTFLLEYQPPKRRGRIRFLHLLAFARTLYRFGIVNRERIYFWKLLVWTQFRRPQLFPEAITLSICGYHYRKIYEQHVA